MDQRGRTRWRIISMRAGNASATTWFRWPTLASSSLGYTLISIQGHCPRYQEAPVQPLTVSNPPSLAPYSEAIVRAMEETCLGSQYLHQHYKNTNAGAAQRAKLLAYVVRFHYNNLRIFKIGGDDSGELPQPGDRV